MRCHTGDAMSFGRGVVHIKSSKQKFNTKSTTKTEVVGVSDYMPYDIWLSNFSKEQGYELIENFVYQDNQSAIKMEMNGWKSCGQKSKHIDIRYFFNKDFVDKKFVKIIYCPTEQMLADFFTKPLQGTLFHRLRAVVMGWEPIETLQSFGSLSTEERVEDCTS